MTKDRHCERSAAIHFPSHPVTQSRSWIATAFGLAMTKGRHCDLRLLPVCPCPLKNDTAFSIIQSMGKAQKLLDLMSNNPLDWTIGQVQTVANAFGLTVHRPGGSHHIVRHSNGAKVSVPAHRPIRAIYIRQFVRLVKFGKGDNG